MYYALTGDIYAGKTSIARALEQDGFLLISFTDLLKKYAVQSLTACGVAVTLNQILEDKSKYRPYLQELSSLIGFNDNPKYVREALAVWDGEKCVFDNVRTWEQWAVLREFGFTLVEVRAGQGVRESRAGDLGVAGTVLQRQSKHHIEGRLAGHADVTLDGSLPPAHNARLLIDLERIMR